MRGDPGFFDTFGRILKGGARLLPGPFGAGARALFPPSGPSIRDFAPPSRAPRLGGRLPDRVTGFNTGGRKRRRMNPANPKALRRAIRRTDSFVTLAKSALKNTGFKIVSKSAGKMTEAAFRKKQHHSK